MTQSHTYYAKLKKDKLAKTISFNVLYNTKLTANWQWLMTSR